MSVADVEAKDILGGLSFALAILDVEDAVRGHVLHRERRVGSDDPGTANRVSWWMKKRTRLQWKSFNSLLKFILEFGHSLRSLKQLSISLTA